MLQKCTGFIQWCLKHALKKITEVNGFYVCLFYGTQKHRLRKNNLSLIIMNNINISSLVSFQFYLA